MVVTVGSDEVSLSSEARARIAHDLRCALDAFQPRVVRATLQIRRVAEYQAGGSSLVQVSVSLGPAGVVRVKARGAGIRWCMATAIRRASDGVARRLTLERRRLLEYLYLVSGAAGGWPPAPRSVVGVPRRSRDPRSRQATRGATASRRGTTPVAA